MNLPECCRTFLGAAEHRFYARHAALLALFDRVRDVPGDIVELGVASGVSLRSWVHLVAKHGSSTRKVWGYDTFTGFPLFAVQDGEMAPAIGKRIGGETEMRDRPVSADAVAESVRQMPEYRDNGVTVMLVEGNILDTLNRVRGIQAALVFCDADTYFPTKAALDRLWPDAPAGALFVFDEYGHEPWPGETKAVDEFLAANPALKLERLDMESGPTACITKK